MKIVFQDIIDCGTNQDFIVYLGYNYNLTLKRNYGIWYLRIDDGNTSHNNGISTYQLII